MEENSEGTSESSESVSESLESAGYSKEDLNDISESIFPNEEKELEDESGLDESKSAIKEEEEKGTPAKEDEGTQAAGISGKYQAPNTWNKEIVAKWNTIPEDIQAEITKRESDFHRGIENYKVAANLGHSFHEIAKDYHDGLKSRGVDTLQLVRGVMEMEKQLATGTNDEKLQIFAKLAQDYGILFNEAGDYEFQDNTIKELRDKIASLESNQAHNTKLVETEQRNKIYTEIDAFKNDPANKHYAAVEHIMAKLISSGTASGLKDAYEQAIYIEPKVRQLEIDRIATEKSELDAKAKAEQVKKAKKLTSSNINSQGSRSISKSKPNGSWEENLDAEFDRIASQS